MSDVIPLDSIVGGKIYLTTTSMDQGVPEMVEITENMLIQGDGVTIMGMYGDEMSFCALATHAGATWMQATFPEPGFYFSSMNNGPAILRAHAFENTTVKTIDPKFIPPTLGGGIMWVDITSAESGGLESSHTGAEIVAAIESGSLVFGRVSSANISGVNVGPASYAQSVDMNAQTATPMVFFPMYVYAEGVVAVQGYVVEMDSTSVRAAAS